MAEFSMSMKLLIDTHSNRVLFAEASKECVDFLFHLLTLPMATVIKLLKQDGMVGSVENLFDSIQNLDGSYVLPHHGKDSLLNPNFRACACAVPVLQIKDHVENQKRFYRCCNCPNSRYNSYSSYCSIRVTDDACAVCPDCSRKMTETMPYVTPPNAVKVVPTEGGFVKGLVTYMVMDDLVVTPMSSISCFSLLNQFKIRDVGVLEAKVVKLGMNEAVKLLKASLHSKEVLTEVFLATSEPKVKVQEHFEDVVKLE